MTWPLSQDYNEAVQDASVAFSDPELRTGEAVANALGIPQPRAGNFADVYEIRCPNGNRWAVKCFTRETPDLQNRYAHISRHLAQKRDRLPFIVDFNYLAQGILVRGRWYPVLKMRWVEGFLLNQFVRDNLEQPQLLLNLAQLWHRMGRRLRETGAAHGDLQHGNVILVPAAGGNSLLLRLIDYDGMYVPSLAGMRASEVGHPSYQHPQRLRERPWNPEVDRFPLLTIYTAIRALAVGGRALWEKYDNGDNMLFRESDFRNTTASPLMRDLIQLGDPEVARLANVMSRATFKPLDQVPLLSDLVAEPKPPEKPAVVAVPVAAVAVPVGPRRRVPALLLVSALVGLLVLVLGGFYLASGGPAHTPLASEPTTTEPETPEPPKETRTTPRAASPDGPTGKRGPMWEGGVGEVCRFIRHGDPVQTVGFTADGKNVLAWSGQTLRLWNIEALNEAWGHDVGGIERVAVSPNGRLAAIAQADGIHLLDLTTRQEMDKLQPPESKNQNRSGVTALAFDAGGRMLLAAGRNGNLHLHTLADRSDRKYPLPTDRKNQDVHTCSLSPDGEHFIHDFGPDVRVVRVASNTEVFRGPPHFTRPVTAVAALTDNLRFVSAGEDKNLFIRSYAGGQGPESGKTKQAMKALAVSPDGTRLLSGGEERFVYLWDLKRMKQLQAFKGHDGRVLSVAFSPDGRFAISGGQDETVRVWRLAEGSGGGGGETPAEKGRELLKIDAKTVAHRVAISPDDGLLLAATPDGIRSWTEDGKPIPRRSGAATALAAMPKGRLVFGGADGEVRQESTTRAGTSTIGRHGKPIRDLALSPSGMFALSCSGESSAILWDVTVPKEQQRFGGPQGSVTCVALSGDGLLALTGGTDGMRLWEVASGNEAGRLEGHRGEVLRAVFFAANRYVASAGEDGTVRFWDVKSRRQLRQFDLRKDEARALAVSPDGRRLLAGGVSGVVRMWDVAAGKELLSLIGHDGALRDIALSSDSRRALTAGEDGTLRLWQLPDVAGGGALDLGTDPVKP